MCIISYINGTHMEASQNACMHGVWLYHFKSSMQLCGCTVKVPENHKQQMTDNTFCHNKDMLWQLLNLTACYSTHDSRLSCVVLCALQQPHV